MGMSALRCGLFMIGFAQVEFGKAWSALREVIHRESRVIPSTPSVMAEPDDCSGHKHTCERYAGVLVTLRED